VSQFIRRYLNEIVSLAVMLMLFVALVDGHYFNASQAQIAAKDSATVVADSVEP